MAQKRTERIAFVVTEEEKDMINRLAEEEDQSMSQFIRKVIKDFIQRKENSSADRIG